MHKATSTHSQRAQFTQVAINAAISAIGYEAGAGYLGWAPSIAGSIASG